MPSVEQTIKNIETKIGKGVVTIDDEGLPRVDFKRITANEDKKMAETTRSAIDLRRYSHYKIEALKMILNLENLSKSDKWKTRYLLFLSQGLMWLMESILGKENVD